LLTEKKPWIFLPGLAHSPYIRSKIGTSFLAFFSHPDFTVGSGIPLLVTGSAAEAGRGLVTAGCLFMGSAGIHRR
jgi:hypothetical protein